MYHRRVGRRYVWFTNDGLIRLWEVARCRVERQARLEGRESPQGGRS